MHNNPLSFIHTRNEKKIIKCKRRNSTVGTVPKVNRKSVDRGNIDNSSTQIHNGSLPWLGTCTLIKNKKNKKVAG